MHPLVMHVQQDFMDKYWLNYYIHENITLFIGFAYAQIGST